jgi:hypothetical protein
MATTGLGTRRINTWRSARGADVLSSGHVARVAPDALVAAEQTRPASPVRMITPICVSRALFERGDRSSRRNAFLRPVDRDLRTVARRS